MPASEGIDRKVATHMLTLMIRGLTFNLNLPIAQFATSGRMLELTTVLATV